MQTTSVAFRIKQARNKKKRKEKKRKEKKRKGCNSRRVLFLML
jgi:hypothetical protein